MTVATTTARVQYTGNGVTTAFATTFKFAANADLIVTLTDTDTGSETAQVLDSDYTVAGAGAAAGGTVTFASPPASTDRVTIERQTTLTQELDYVENDPFPAESHEGGLDKLTMAAQEHRTTLARALKLSASDLPAALNNLPQKSDRASRVLGFDASGQPTAGALIANIDATIAAFLGGVSIGEISSVGDIATMEALIGMTDKQVIRVIGYHANSRVGGGYFQFVSGSDATVDNGQVFTAVAGRWMRIWDGVADVRFWGAKCDGTTADTAAVQAALDANPGHLIIPDNCKHGPVTVTNTVRIIFKGDVVPDFDTSTTESLYTVTAPDCVFEDVSVSSYAATIAANKYFIRTDTGGDRIKIIRPRFVDITASDGNTGATNLLVTHPIYLENIDGPIVSMGNFNNISGAAIFLKTVTNYSIVFNEFDDTRWYTINADHDCFDGVIAFNKFSGDGVNARYWGGSVNLMSQTTGNKNKRVKVVHNTFTGVHNYGAVVRALSVEDCLISKNTFYNITSGSLAASTEVQNVAIDRRGTAEGSPEGGPCKNVTVSNNVMTAGTGSHFPIYIKNQYKATRDPHENITITDNLVYSLDSSTKFENFLMVHGNKSGIKGLKVRGNIAKFFTKSGSAVGGGIGLVSTNADGVIEDYDIGGNTLEELTSSVPNQSYQIGIYVQASAQNGTLKGNTLKNFRYGIRTAASLTNIVGCNDNTFIGCLDDVLYGTAPAGGGFDMSMGTALPINGVYRVGHIRQDIDAAASASWGWIVTTAGGAMTGAWAAGATYTAGVWYRNAAGRVYELITAGGGVTADEPTGTTVGTDETAGDGYVWRCRATTSARWAPLAALSAVAALP